MRLMVCTGNEMKQPLSREDLSSGTTNLKPQTLKKQIWYQNHYSVQFATATTLYAA
jgi:hypothetical protein